MKKREALEILGSRIRKIRVGRGFSQEKLAEYADINRNYVGEVERGERNVAALNLLRIARALGVDPSELFKDLRLDVLRELKLP